MLFGAGGVRRRCRRPGGCGRLPRRRQNHTRRRRELIGPLQPRVLRPTFASGVVRLRKGCAETQGQSAGDQDRLDGCGHAMKILPGHHRGFNRIARISANSLRSRTNISCSAAEIGGLTGTGGGSGVRLLKSTTLSFIANSLNAVSHRRGICADWLAVMPQIPVRRSCPCCDNTPDGRLAVMTDGR